MKKWFRNSPYWIAFCILLLCWSGIRAQQPNIYQDSSLKFIPASTTIYSAHMRMGEQWNWLINSNAAKHVMESSVIKEFMAEARLQILKNRNWKQIIDFITLPDNKELMALAKDLLANEVYLAGGPNLPKWMELLLGVVGELQMERQFAALAGPQDPKDMIRLAMKLLTRHANDLVVPELVLGFKVNEKEAAAKEQARLEKLVTDMLDRVAFLQGKLKNRVSIAGGTFTVFEISGKDLPLEQIPWSEIEEEADEFKKLKDRLPKLTFNVAVGLRDGYVTLSIGPDTKFLSQLGDSSKLADIPEMQPLRKHADKKAYSLGFTSKAINNLLVYSMENLEKQMKELLQHLDEANIPDDIEQRLRKDLKELPSDLYLLMGSESGARANIEFSVPSGREGFSYFFGTEPHADASKPLTLMSNVGESPLAFFAGRAKYEPKKWDIFVKWCKKADGYIHDFLLPQLPDGAQGEVADVLNDVYPLLKRFDKTMRENWIPGTADSQSAFVVDDKWSSKQWQKEMPEADKALRMPQPALLLSVSDSSKVKASWDEFRKLFNDAVDVIRKKAPIPEEVQWPAPKTKTVTRGTVYYYTLPDEAGIDKQIVLAAGLSDKVASAAFSITHAESLLSEKKPNLTESVLIDLSKNRSSAWFVDTTRLVDLIDPLVQFGLMHDRSPDVDKAKDVISRIMKASKLVRQFSSETYHEDKMIVTHHHVKIKDID